MEPSTQCSKVEFIFVLCPILLFIELVILSLRVYTRARVLKAFWWDDWFMIGAVALSIPAYGLIIDVYNAGLGRSLLCISHAALRTLPSKTRATQDLTLLSPVFARTSVALLITRVFAVMNKPTRIFLWSAIGVMWVLAILALIFTHQPGTPLDKHNPTVYTGWVVQYFYGADCIFTDTLLSALPCFFLWHVQMKRRLKLAVGLLLSLGMTTAICAAVRVGYLKAALMNKNASGSSASIAFTLAAILEFFIAIVAGSIPTLRPLFTHKHPSGRSGYSRQFHHSNTQWGAPQAHTKRIPTPMTAGHHETWYDSSHSQTAAESGLGDSDALPLVPVDRIGRRVDVEVV